MVLGHALQGVTRGKWSWQMTIKALHKYSIASNLYFFCCRFSGPKYSTKKFILLYKGAGTLNILHLRIWNNNSWKIYSYWLLEQDISSLLEPKWEKLETLRKKKKRTRRTRTRSRKQDMTTFDQLASVDPHLARFIEGETHKQRFQVS